MSEEQNDAAAGLEAARMAIIALADNDEPAALAALNATSHGAAVWAAACLLGALREAVSGRVGHDPRRLELALKAGAAGMLEDQVMTQVALIVNDAARNGEGGRHE